MRNSNQLYIDILMARIHVDKTLEQIDGLMLTASGTPEDRRKKMQSLASKLDQNIETEKKAMSNYTQMVRTITGPKAGDMKRSAFNGLAPNARSLFIENGGKVID